jgi:hypothetical protein
MPSTMSRVSKVNLVIIPSTDLDRAIEFGTRRAAAPGRPAATPRSDPDGNTLMIVEVS